MARTADAAEAVRAAAEDALATAMAVRRTVAGVVARMLRGEATENEIDGLVTRAVRAVDAAGRIIGALDVMQGGGMRQRHA